MLQAPAQRRALQTGREAAPQQRLRAAATRRRRRPAALSVQQQAGGRSSGQQLQQPGCHRCVRKPAARGGAAGGSRAHRCGLQAVRKRRQQGGHEGGIACRYCQQQLQVSRRVGGAQPQKEAQQAALPRQQLVAARIRQCKLPLRAAVSCQAMRRLRCQGFKDGQRGRRRLLGLLLLAIGGGTLLIAVVLLPLNRR